MKQLRLNNIDFMKSIAIILMIIANTSPYALKLHHSFFFRLTCSLAAPIFIFLSGHVFFNSFINKLDYKSKLITFCYLILTAMIIDSLLWRNLPFQTFDVLYLIGIGLLCNIIIFNLKWTIKILISIIILIISFLIQNITDYRFNIEDKAFATLNFSNLGDINFFQIKRFFIDGWFPIFPWLFFSIIGTVIAEKKDWIFRKGNFLILISSLVFVISLIVFLNNDSIQSEREGYVELFYPPTILYIVMAASFLLLFYSLSIKIRFNNHLVVQLINLIGRYSLFIYFLHILVISNFLAYHFTSLNVIQFVLLIFCFLFFCFMMVYIIERIKNNELYLKVPNFIKHIVGIK